MSSKDARSSNVKILGGAVVCNECELKGDITIGARTVIHPKARIIAESGPIIIGLIIINIEIITFDERMLSRNNNACHYPSFSRGRESY